MSDQEGMLPMALHTSIDDVPDHPADAPHHLSLPTEEDHLRGNDSVLAPLHPFVTPHLPSGDVPVVLLQDVVAMSLPIKND